MRFRVSLIQSVLGLTVCCLHVSVAAGIPAEISAQAREMSGAVAGCGLAVHVGCGDGRLSAGLSTDGRLLVHALETDPQELREARSYLMGQGLYGQVTASLWDGVSLPYVDDLVNLLVIEDRGELTVDEIMRVLVPNGTAYIKSGEKWERRTKPRSAEIDEWSHWLHGPDNNAVSNDSRVGISRSLQWYMPPKWSRHHNLPAGFNSLVSGGGRAYYMIDRGPKAVYGPGRWVLVARDAFNGLELWRRNIEDWNMEAWKAKERFGGRVGRFHGAPDYQAPRRIVAAGDRIFMTLGFNAPVSALDGATGKLLMEYSGTESAGEIIHSDGILYVARNIYEPEPAKEIMAVDASTGKILWQNGDYQGIAAAVGYQQQHTNAFITAGDNNLFLVDENDIVALDMQTGKEQWKRRMPLTDETVGDIDYRYSNFCTLVYHGGRVFFCQIHPGTKNMNKWEMKKLQIEAIDAGTGKLEWDYVGGTLAHVTPADLFVTGGKVWTLDHSLGANGNNDARLLGLDCRTGEEKENLLLEKITHSHHHRCYRNKATQKYYLMGEEGIEYIDFESGETDVHYWLRGACRYGIMPANGFIYVPPHNCGCYLGTLLHGMLALKAAQSHSVGSAPPVRLRKGQAYNAQFDATTRAGELDWPMFRRDSTRKCSSSVELNEELSRQWTSSPGGKLTPPVVVKNNVFLASTDNCQVYCLDADTGRLEWRFAADGPLNAPPTYVEGRLVFGTGAGTVYVLTAADGKLVWSFKAGPSAVHIVSFGRLESPWPLNGSPIVMNGSVYCLAGRSMSLDSGLFLYRLDLETGRALQKVNFCTDPAPKGETEDNLLADMLVGDGTNIYMKSIRVDPGDITNHSFAGRSGRRGSTKTPQEVLRCQTEMIDDSWLNCCFWAYRGCLAQQLVFDSDAVYGISGPNKVKWGGSFAHDVYRPGSGYRLQKWVLAGEKGGGDGQKRKKGGKGGGVWKDVRVGVRGRSMALTANRLYIAGIPDENPGEDYWAAYENRKGAKLLAVSRDNGTSIGEYSLDSEPVYNGIAVSGKGLLLCLRDGSVVCFR